MLLTTICEKKLPGTYAGIRFTAETIEQIKNLQKELEVPEPLGSSDFHSTLLYSRKHLPDYKAAGKLSPLPVADTTEYKLEIWPSHSDNKKVLVLKYACEWLESRHKFLMDEHGATWDHPNYKPHITLSYDVGDWKPESMTVTFDAPITLSKEYQSDLDPDW